MTNDTPSNQRPLPDPEICRAMYLGQTLEFSSCLMDNATGCEYAMRFASCVFCYHPERRRFEKAGSP